MWTHTCNDTKRKLLPLPTRFGGLAIHIFHEQAEVEYSNSRKLTTRLTRLIKNQNKEYMVEKTQIKIAKQVIKKEKEDQCHTSLDQLRDNLSEKSKRLLSIGKGLSNWLTVPSIKYFLVSSYRSNIFGM